MPWRQGYFNYGLQIPEENYFLCVFKFCGLEVGCHWRTANGLWYHVCTLAAKCTLLGKTLCIVLWILHNLLIKVWILLLKSAMCKYHFNTVCTLSLCEFLYLGKKACFLTNIYFCKWNCNIKLYMNLYEIKKGQIRWISSSTGIGCLLYIALISACCNQSTSAIPTFTAWMQRWVVWVKDCILWTA